MNELQKQFEEESGKKWFIVPYTHGENAYASWEYQLWLEAKAIQMQAPVKPAFGGLTVIERKELERIWNGKTNYGKHPMTYQRFLEAGLEIIIGCTNASQKSV